MISRIPKVFTIKSIINQYFCLFCEDRHSDNPFQKIDHAAKIIIRNGGIKSNK